MNRESLRPGEEVNRRLAMAISAIGQAADQRLKAGASVELHAGRLIGDLIREHIGSRRVYVGLANGGGLDIVDGELYRTPSRFDRLRDRWPLPDQEWFTYWREILNRVTCL